MKIQMDLPKDLNNLIKIEKAIRKNVNLQETVVQILEEYFDKNNKEVKND